MLIVIKFKYNYIMLALIHKNICSENKMKS